VSSALHQWGVTNLAYYHITPESLGLSATEWELLLALPVAVGWLIIIRILSIIASPARRHLWRKYVRRKGRHGGRFDPGLGSGRRWAADEDDDDDDDDEEDSLQRTVRHMADTTRTLITTHAAEVQRLHSEKDLLMKQVDALEEELDRITAAIDDIDDTPVRVSRAGQRGSQSYNPHLMSPVMQTCGGSVGSHSGIAGQRVLRRGGGGGGGAHANDANDANAQDTSSSEGKHYADDDEEEDEDQDRVRYGGGVDARNGCNYDYDEHAPGAGSSSRSSSGTSASSSARRIIGGGGSSRASSTTNTPTMNVVRRAYVLVDGTSNTTATVTKTGGSMITNTPIMPASAAASKNAQNNNNNSNSGFFSRLLSAIGTDNDTDPRVGHFPSPSPARRSTGATAPGSGQTRREGK